MQSRRGPGYGLCIMSIFILCVSLSRVPEAVAEDPSPQGLPTVAPGTRMDVELPVAAGAESPGTFIPVTIFRGAKDGPRLVVVAGVHGYEFAPILALQSLAATIEPSKMRGTLVLVKTAHVPAFEARSPYVNPFDRKNLNRSFPGSPDGTQTERIAWVLSEQVIKDADFVIDVHSGDGAEWLDAFVGVYGGKLATNYEQALDVAHAFRFPSIVRYRMELQVQVDTRRSLNRQAVAAGAPTLLIEIGENGERNPDDIAAIVSGLQGALQRLEMVPAQPAPAAEAYTPRYFDGTTSVRVEHSGIWSPSQKIGRQITKGESLGVITGFDGGVLQEVLAPADGFAIYGLAGPPVRAGDSVMTIARPIDTLE